MKDDVKFPDDELKRAFSYVQNNFESVEDQATLTTAAVLALYVEQKKQLASVKSNVRMIAIPFILTYIVLAIGAVLFVLGVVG